MERRIHTEADLAHHIAALRAADPRLAGVADAVGDQVPLRRMPPGLAGLLRIVMGQQLSIHAAAAVWARLEAACGAIDPARLGALDDAALRAAGLSRQKTRTLRAILASDIANTLERPASDAARREALLAVTGIGPWTADLYLIVCEGAPDVLPTGDLALRKSAGRALGLAQEPSPAALEAIARAWAPHRSAAARLLWAYYRVAPEAAPARGAGAGDSVDDRAPV